MKIILDVSQHGESMTFMRGDEVTLTFHGDDDDDSLHYFATVTIDGFKKDGRINQRMFSTAKEAL